LLALSLCALLVAGAEVADPEETSSEFRTPPAEFRLLDRSFVLRLNTGGFATRRVTGAAPAQGPAAAFDFTGTLDIAARRGRLRLGGGDERKLRFAVEWNVEVDRDMARVHSQVDFAILGRGFTLTPPDVRVRPRFDGRDPGVEVNLPLIEGRF
jgi:hypothetical protein